MLENEEVCELNLLLDPSKDKESNVQCSNRESYEVHQNNKKSNGTIIPCQE